MSGILDYWPFDYKRYFSEILPAFQQFAQGHLEPIQNLLEQAKAEDLPIFYKPTLSLNELEPILEQHPEYRSVLHRWPRWSEEQYLEFMRNGFPRDEDLFIYKQMITKVSGGRVCIDSLSWNMLQAIAPFRVGSPFNQPDHLCITLHIALLYAFCSAPIPETPHDNLLNEDESIWTWYYYLWKDDKDPKNAPGDPLAKRRCDLETPGICRNPRMGHAHELHARRLTLQTGNILPKPPMIMPQT